MNWELRCLNCSRHLADVVRADDGRSRLRPPFGRVNCLSRAHRCGCT